MLSKNKVSIYTGELQHPPVFPVGRKIAFEEEVWKGRAEIMRAFVPMAVWGKAMGVVPLGKLSCGRPRGLTFAWLSLHTLWPILLQAVSFAVQLSSAQRGLTDGRKSDLVHLAAIASATFFSLRAHSKIPRLLSRIEGFDRSVRWRLGPDLTGARSGRWLPKILALNCCLFLTACITLDSRSATEVAYVTTSLFLQQPFTYNLFLYAMLCDELRLRFGRLGRAWEIGFGHKAAHLRVPLLAEIRRLHLRLLSTVAALRDLFGSLLFVILLFYVFLILKSILLSIITGQTTRVILTLEYFVVCVYLIRGIAYRTENMINESKGTMKNTFVLPTAHFDSQSKAEVFLFVQQLRFNIETVSCLGLFSVNMQLLGAVITSIVTNTIALTQFASTMDNVPEWLEGM